MWKSLTDVLGSVPFVTNITDLKQSAAKIALDTFGTVTTHEPLLINVTALRLCLPKELTVYEITTGVSGQIDATDIHNFPSLCPDFLKKAFVLESKKPEHPLFGNTSSLGGYWIDGNFYLVGIGCPDGATLHPVWDGREITGNETNVLGDTAELNEWAKDAMRYVLILSLLMEAERTPVMCGSGKSHKSTIKRGNKKQWIVERVYLNKKYISQAQKSEDNIFSTDGKTQKTVPVRGFIRSQHYGANNTQIKFVYIESFEARRWIIPGPRKFIIS